MNWINNIIYIVLLGIVMLFNACEDNRLNDIVDDKVYLLKYGLNEQEVLNLSGYTCEVILIKSGIGQQSGTVKLTANEQLLDEYNVNNATEYLPLPAELYSIPNPDAIIGSEDYRIAYQIEMNASGIKELQNQTGQTYVIPLQAQITSGNFAESEPAQLETLLIPRVVDPYLSLADTGLVSGATVLNFDSPDEVMLFSEVQVNFPNQMNIDFEVEIAPELIQEYNERNGTSFEILNSDAYEVDESTLTFKDFEVEHAFGITIHKNGFITGDDQYLFGEYLIPIRISSSGDIDVDPIRRTQLLQVSFRPNLLDRSGWEITEWNSCICEEPQYESLARVPENLLDGDPDTFWGSKWDEPKPFPYHFVFDMKSTHKIYQLELIKPASDAWRGNIKSGFFEISDDGDSWTRVGEWDIEDNGPRGHIFQITPQSCRYIKLVIEDAFVYFNEEVGIESGANVDISEFVAWGQ